MGVVPYISVLEPHFASPEPPKGGISQERGIEIFERYSEWLTAQERPCFRESGTYFSERQWQTYLHQKRFGTRWITQEGEVVEILNFGKWNHEEGPDFLDALVKIGDQPPAQGDLELDRDVRDWEYHYHAQKRTYRKVLVHFFFEKPAEYTVFTRSVDGKQICQVHLDPSQMKSSALRNVRAIFAAVPLPEAMNLIESAARFRMLRKQETFHRKATLVGFSAALFQEIATVLGYRPNGLPFHLLARCVGRESAASSLGEALLFGVAGFLRGEEFMRAPQNTRKYLRQLWDLWWPYQSSFRQLSPQIWKRTSVRPFNYPERRVGALSLIAKQFSFIEELVSSKKEKEFVGFMKSLHHPFWQTHFSFFSNSHEERLLLGEERTLDLLVNVFYPAQAVQGPDIWDHFRTIRLPEVPQKVLEAASIFIGEERLSQTRLREAVIQQGLLQMISHFSSLDFFSLY